MNRLLLKLWKVLSFLKRLRLAIVRTMEEHPYEALAREVEEETGYIIRADRELGIRTDRETARLDISLLGHLIGGEFRANPEVTGAKFCKVDDLPLLRQSQLTLIQQALKN